MVVKTFLPRHDTVGRAACADSAQPACVTQGHAAIPAWLADHGAALNLFPAIGLGAAPAAIMAALIAHTAWRQDSIRLFGRTCPQPRLTAWHGDPAAAYRYSGLLLHPAAWTPLLDDLRARVQALAGATFNAVLLNYYRGNTDSMGMHADDEPELGPAPVIASLSLGAERILRLRHKTNRALPTVRIPLPDASLLVMRGQTQRLWKHGIDKRRALCGPRVNLTFRLIQS